MKTSTLKNTSTLFIMFLFGTFFCNSCVEEYWPNLEDQYDSFLVIEGMISNESGPYTVKISRSTSIKDPSFDSFSGATVTLMDDLGNAEVLTQIEPGIYQSGIGGMLGVIGRSYKIQVLANGNTYESSFEEILPPVAIEEIHEKEDILYAESDNEEDQTGYRFYVSSVTAPDKKNYYYYELEETYEYHASHTIEFIMYPQDQQALDSSAYELPRSTDPYKLFQCWKTNYVNERFVQTTEYLSQPKINDFPLHFVPYESEKLKIEYSLQVKQLSISENAYVFYNNIYEQNSDQGSLFSKQPFQLSGNISNINDPKEPVLGYFYAAGASQPKRLFTKAPPSTNHFENNCNAVYEDLVYYIKNATFTEWPVYLTFLYFPNPSGGEALEFPALVTKECIDCTAKGGTTTKPAFWDQH